ncbi:MAG: thiolase family protein [Candidatus Omnitrophica bacterium]|nr:thiolase family protein [Candidatus Omnitrophota bacterium]
MATDVVIVSGVRTPQGNLGGALKDFPSARMGQIVTTELLKRTGVDPKLIEHLIFGCVVQGSDAPNVARVIGLRSGIPKEVPAYTVQRNCASGLQAIHGAWLNIQAAEADLQVAGGTESMSQAPYVSRDMRFGKHLRDSVLVDSLWEGLTDPVCCQIMGETAENLVAEFGISRQEQDRFAALSHQRAFRATREGRFRDEIVPVTIPKKAYGRELPPEIMTQDETINPALSEQILSQYPAVFKKEGGSVTPGNSCPISDGAAAVLVMSARRAKELELTPMVRIRGFGFAGVEPQRMGIGPVEAVPIALRKAGVALKDIGLIELNEAFAAQVIAVEKKLGLNREILNVNGGAIALGHPVGATGARVVITLMNEMKRRNVPLGLATMCVGGGQGGAIVVERV